MPYHKIYSIGGITESPSYKIATYIGERYFSKYLECQPIPGTEIILQNGTGSAPTVFTAGTASTGGVCTYDGDRTISCSQYTGSSSGGSGSGELVPDDGVITVILDETTYILYETAETEAGTYLFVGVHNDTYSHGKYSALLGTGLVAQYECQTAIGKYNSNNKNNVFEIGNGTWTQRSNALTVDWNGQVQCQGIGSLNGSYSEIFVGNYSDRAKQINSSLTTSSSDDLWLKAAITAICQDYPNKQSAIFKGQLNPNSQGYFKICIYNTSLVSGGLPQYSFGTWNKWQSTFWIISTNNYAFAYTAK